MQQHLNRLAQQAAPPDAGTSATARARATRQIAAALRVIAIGCRGRVAGMCRVRRILQQLAQTVGVQPHFLCDSRQQQFLIDTGRYPGQQRSRQRHVARTAVGMRHIGLLAQLCNQIFRERQRAAQAGFKCGAAFAANHGIGIFAVRQKQKAQFAPFARFRQGVLQRSPGGGATGAITVKCEHDFTYQAKRPAQLLRRGRGAQCRRRVGQARLVESHHIHIAFHQQEPVQSGARQANFVQPVELMPFMKELGFR